MIAPALMLAFLALAAPQAPLPALSPSIEADAEYLLTTEELSSAQFGMAVEQVSASDGRVTIRTTGATFVLEPAANRLTLAQRIGARREIAEVAFPAGRLRGLAVTRRSPGSVLLSADGGRLTIRVNGDSLLMLRDESPLKLRWRIGFSPKSVRASQGNMLLLDEYGAFGAYLATPGGAGCVDGPRGTVACGLDGGQILWLAVGPPRAFRWQQSLDDRVLWHWSMETGYPTDAEIEKWSPYGNILLQQSEVMLWKDWSLRFLPRNGIEEFERVNRTCERLGLRNIVYTSPLYFLTGTGLESKAMNSFEHFAETGFSPGDGRGLNWPIFVAEIAKVVREYRPDGLYFDGIYDSVVRTYIVARKAREIVGDHGLLEYHATASPPGGGVYLPQIDTYFDFLLRGEGCEAHYASPDYLRYFVSTYNISNSIGVLCNNNPYPLDEAFVATLLDDNIRLHYSLGGPDDQRTIGMERSYWPKLNGALRGRVERAAAARQAEWPSVWEAMREARESTGAGQPVLYRASLDQPGLTVSAPTDATELPDGWTACVGPRSGGRIAPRDGALRIEALGNSFAFLERALPAETATIACRVRGEGECGMSWGPAIALRAGGRAFRLGVRSDGRAQIDRTGGQELFDGFAVGEWHWLRMRFVAGCLAYEASDDGTHWRLLAIDHVGSLEGPLTLLVGKVPYNVSKTEYTEIGGPGVCELADVQVLGPATAR